MILVLTQFHHDPTEFTPAMVENAPFLSGLSPIMGKPVQLAFDGGRLTSDAGVLVLAEIEQRLGIAERLSACLDDPRSSDRIRHGLAEMIRFRMLMVAGGYEDANDCDALRADPAFKIAVGRLPESGADLCSQPTMCRLENLPGKIALSRMMDAMAELFCDSFKTVPRRLVLDIDDTLDRVHGHQQLSLFHAHHDHRCFLPIHIYDAASGKPVAVILRPGKTPNGAEVLQVIRHLVRAIRHRWPKVEITIRGDSHYARHEAMAWCERNQIGYIPACSIAAKVGPAMPALRSFAPADRDIFGLAGNKALLRQIATLAEDVSMTRVEGKSKKVRRYDTFSYAARSWHVERQVIARIEASQKGADSRFVVTNLSGAPRWLYDKVYCARGQAENLIKAHKLHLASDRTSCSSATANQFRLLIHTAAYGLLHTLRGLAPKRPFWQDAQFDTIRLALIKVAARVTEMVTKVKVALPSTFPYQNSFGLLVQRTAKLPP